MMLMLLDEPVIEVFQDPTSPPAWIESIDIENDEFSFCDTEGQRYIGVVTEPARWFRGAVFELRPTGDPDLANVLSLVDRAILIVSNPHFADLEALLRHLKAKQTAPPPSQTL